MLVKRENITQSSNKGEFNSPTIIKYKSMITDVPNDPFLQNETSKINATDDDKDTTKINNFPCSTDLAIEDMLPE